VEPLCLAGNGGTVKLTKAVEAMMKQIKDGLWFRFVGRESTGMATTMRSVREKVLETEGYECLYLFLCRGTFYPCEVTPENEMRFARAILSTIARSIDHEQGQGRF